MAAAPVLRRRRVMVLCASLAVPVALVLGLGHRGVHMVRSMVVPGAGLVGSNNVAAAACLLAAISATVAWVKWGLDWLLAGVVAVAVVASGLVTDAPHATAAAMSRPVMAAHEFPLVLLAAGLVSWARGVVGRVPGLSHLARRRARTSDGLASVDRLRPADRSRTAAVLALAGQPGPAAAIAADPEVARRARRVGAWARGRRGGDAFRVDHAHARAAFALAGTPDPMLLHDAARTALGVPCSEPTWVRPVDGALAAIAVHHAGGDTGAWQRALGAELSLRRGHRPAWYWTPLGWPAGSAPAWEHATATALARAMGWVGDDDWAALRTRALGASARGVEHPHDERLIAAARVWLVYVDDPRTASLLARPTVRHDPLAVALDLLARRLADDPDSLTVSHPEVLA
ncbi:MAG: hypothetical protein RL238_652 [Actinomycetota bacterium]